MGDSSYEISTKPRIEQAESALFQRFLSKLDEGRYDECDKITGLMERLSLI